MRSATAVGGRIVSYRPGGNSTDREAHSRRRESSDVRASTSTSSKSTVGTPAQVERAKSDDLVLISAWPAGWSWHHDGQSLYLQMILGIYATLGVFLLIASRDPLAHASLIWFTVWSSVVHGGIMALQSIAYPEHMGHLWGDVPALLIVAAVLAFLMPRRAAAATEASVHAL